MTLGRTVRQDLKDKLADADFVAVLSGLLGTRCGPGRRRNVAPASICIHAPIPL